MYTRVEDLIDDGSELFNSMKELILFRDSILEDRGLTIGKLYSLCNLNHVCESLMIETLVEYQCSNDLYDRLVATPDYAREMSLLKLQRILTGNDYPITLILKIADWLQGSHRARSSSKTLFNLCEKSFSYEGVLYRGSVGGARDELPISYSKSEDVAKVHAGILTSDKEGAPSIDSSSVGKVFSIHGTGLDINSMLENLKYTLADNLLARYGWEEEVVVTSSIASEVR